MKESTRLILYIFIGVVALVASAVVNIAAIKDGMPWWVILLQ